MSQEHAEPASPGALASSSQSCDLCPAAICLQLPSQVLKGRGRGRQRMEGREKILVALFVNNWFLWTCKVSATPS